MTAQKHNPKVREISFHGAGVSDSKYLVRRDDGLYWIDRNGFMELLTDVSDDDLNSNAKCSFNYQYAFDSCTDQPSDESLELLGTHMRKVASGADVVGSVPSGYTYFGQLIFHDITWFDENCETESKNRASATLDMDSILGNTSGDALLTSSEHFGCPLAIGPTVNESKYPEDLPRGVSGDPRCYSGLAYIPDTRNDNFLPLAQMHMLAIKFYNTLAKKLGRTRVEIDPDVKREFMLHMQSVVLDDYLKTIVFPDVYNDVIQNGRCIVEPGINISRKYELPIEFAAAAGRFGHSMIRTHYRNWSKKRHGTLNRFMLNTFTHGRGADSCFAGLENEWITNWAKLFDLNDGSELINAALINTSISHELASLPESVRGGDKSKKINLAVETLKRQRSLNLACAEQCIDKINTAHTTQKIQTLSPDQLVNTKGHEEPAEIRRLFSPDGPLRDRTPIWFYVLKEAEIKGCGSSLGPFGSRLVMETVHAAIASAEHSIIDSSNDEWKPVIKERGEFMISDLIKFSTATHLQE